MYFSQFRELKCVVRGQHNWVLVRASLHLQMHPHVAGGRQAGPLVSHRGVCHLKTSSKPDCLPKCAVPLLGSLPGPYVLLVPLNMQT